MASKAVVHTAKSVGKRAAKSGISKAERKVNKRNQLPTDLEAVINTPLELPPNVTSVHAYWARRTALQNGVRKFVLRYYPGLKFHNGAVDFHLTVRTQHRFKRTRVVLGLDDGKEVELSVPGKKPEEVLELVQDPTLWPAPQEAKAAPQKQRKQPQQPQLDEAEAMS